MPLFFLNGGINDVEVFHFKYSFCSFPALARIYSALEIGVEADPNPPPPPPKLGVK